MTAAKLNRRFILLATPSIALTACGSIIGPPPSSQMYALSNRTGHATAGAKVDWALAIAKPDALDSLDTNRIALASGDAEFDYFANVVWTDHLPDLIQAKLLTAFETTDRIAVVGREKDEFHADYRLLTEIRDFEARYSISKSEPPSVSVTIVAHAINIHTHQMTPPEIATSIQACSQNTVSAVIEAFNLASAEVIARIVNWMLSLPAPAGPPA